MIGVAIFGVASGTTFTLLGLFLWGAGGGHNWVMSSAASQSNTDDEYMGRVAAADALLFSLGSSGAALLSGYVSESLQWAEAGCWSTFGLGGVLWVSCLLLRLRSPREFKGEAFSVSLGVRSMLMPHLGMSMPSSQPDALCL